MTTLERRVRRVVPGTRRRLVVTLELGLQGTPLLNLRELGRRDGYTVPVETVFLMLAQRAADAARDERRRSRKEGRK